MRFYVYSWLLNAQSIQFASEKQFDKISMFRDSKKYLHMMLSEQETLDPNFE